MSIFPDHIDKILRIIAKERKIELRMRESYEGTVNRELYWFEGNIQKRMHFAIVGSRVATTYYHDTFPACPKLLIWCHNYIPMFPYYAKIKWESLGEMSLAEAEAVYYEKIRSYIEYATNQ
jgi:hypothetical protein